MANTKLSNSGLTGAKYNALSADNNYMETIASTLLTGNTSTITFSNIPQGYKHLQIRAITRDTFAGGNGNNMGIYVNGDTASNYAVHYLLGLSSGSASAGAGPNNPYIIGNFGGTSTTAANCFGVGITDILDYSNTNKYKTTRTLTGVDDNSTGQVRFWSGIWLNTAAITSLTLFPQNSASYVQYSRFSLYGIKG